MSPSASRTPAGGDKRGSCLRKGHHRAPPRADNRPQPRFRRSDAPAARRPIPPPRRVVSGHRLHPRVRRPRQPPAACDRRQAAPAAARHRRGRWRARAARRGPRGPDGRSCPAARASREPGTGSLASASSAAASPSTDRSWIALGAADAVVVRPDKSVFAAAAAGAPLAPPPADCTAPARRCRWLRR